MGGGNRRPLEAHRPVSMQKRTGGSISNKVDGKNQYLRLSSDCHTCVMAHTILTDTGHTRKEGEEGGKS